MYLDTSVDLLDHLRIKQDAKVIDLACGTGVTTRAVLDRLGDNGRIWAVDASEPMLEIARRRIPDRRVNWRLGNALDLSRLVDHGVDDAVCNSAIWQLGPLDSLFPAVRSVLRSGAQFACNWGQGFVADPPSLASPRGLGALLTEVAHRRNLVDASRFRQPSLPSIDQIVSTIENAGFSVVERWWTPQTNSPEASYEWWKIPIFSDWLLGHVPPETRRALLGEAWELWNPKHDSVIHWLCIRAEAV
jgi:trans-aconitate methyltransferase